MTHAGATLLEARGLAKVYARRGGSLRALEGVDVVVRQGESLGIVGESGAGKTTILNILTGIENPTAGRVTYRGDVLRVDDRAQMGRFRREVQVVFQDPYTSLDPRMRVGQIVAEPLRSLRVGADQAARVRDVLSAVGLDPAVVMRYPGEFSGGQRQRIAIARALAPSPLVVIADEPVSSLDVTVRSQILDLLDSLKARLGLTLVLVSHDLAVVGRLCDRVMVLKDGSVVETGATRAIFESPRSAYTQRLLDAVPVLPVP
jgi:ABC-type glutathione transport system ATPase component